MGEDEAPTAVALWQAEPRVGTARRAPEATSAQWQMEMLRPARGDTMRCAAVQAKANAQASILPHLRAHFVAATGVQKIR